MENNEIKIDAISKSKNYEIDFDKIKTINDVKSILKWLQIRVCIYNDNIPEDCKELFDKNLLIDKE